MTKPFCVIISLLMWTATAGAQSLRECRDPHGNVWYQERPCPAEAAPGNVLRKCVDSKGKATFQNAMCPTGSRETKARTYQPEYQPTYNARSAAEKIEADRQAIRRDNAMRRLHSSGGATGASIGLARNPDRCEAAKRERQRAFDQNWRRRSTDYSRAWDDHVRDACK